MEKCSHGQLEDILGMRTGSKLACGFKIDFTASDARVVRRVTVDIRVVTVIVIVVIGMVITSTTTTTNTDIIIVFTTDTAIVEETLIVVLLITVLIYRMFIVRFNIVRRLVIAR